MKAKPPGVPNERLRQARQQRGWSQGHLADLLLTNSFTVSRWERGRAFPSPFYVQKLVSVFGQRAEALGLLPPAAGLAAGNTAEVQHPSWADTSVPSPPVSDPLLPPSSAQPPRLIGREELLAQLKARLLTGHTLVLSALQGLPGVGKTTLALALAQDAEVRAHFADGLLWAGLGQTPHVQETLARWGTLLGLPPAQAAGLSTTQAWAQTLRTAIGERRLLIILDDVWRLEDALACQVGGAACAYLVTTRRSDLALEVAGAGLVAVSELAEAEGLRLLAALAPQVVEAEPEEARALVRAVGGLPLGLLLLGKYLHREALSGQPRRLRAALERLHQGADRLRLAQLQAPLATHPSLPAGIPLSLEASIGLSVTTLPEPAQTMLAALALFPPKPNTFSEEAALTVSRGTPETLDTLVDAGLVESAAPGRYRLHQTIADYARLKRPPADPSRRLAAFFAQYARVHHTDAALLDQESGNILAALQAAFDQEMSATLVAGATAFAPFLLLRGDYATADVHLTRAQQAARAAGQLVDLAMVHLHLGRLAVKRGDYVLAEATLLAGLPLARQPGAETTLSALLQTLGLVQAKRGDPEQAERYYQESLQLASQSGDQETISLLLRNLGGVAHKRGDVMHAEQYYQEALTLARQMGQHEQAGVLLTNLGVVALTQGAYVQAEAYFQEGLACSRQIGDRENMSRSLTNLGVMATERGAHAPAEVYQREALELARQIGHREMIAVLLTNLGDLAGKRQDVPQAEQLLQEGLTLARALHHRYLISYNLEAWGELHLRQRRFDQASAAFSEALTIAREVQGQEVLALACYGLARVAAAQGHLALALQQGQESLRLLEAVGHARTADVQQWLASLPMSVNGRHNKRAD